MPIVNGRQTAILWLPHALELYTSKGVVLYLRVSDRAQLANGSLERQRKEGIKEAQGLGCRLIAAVMAREPGKLSAPRRRLDYAGLGETSRRHRLRARPLAVHPCGGVRPPPKLGMRSQSRRSAPRC